MYNAASPLLQVILLGPSATRANISPKCNYLILTKSRAYQGEIRAETEQHNTILYVDMLSMKKKFTVKNLFYN
jgi:hypothetical protein